MIGQKRLLGIIDKLAEKDFPRFVLLVGARGSGKKLLSKAIADKLGYPLVPIGVSVEEVREVITNSYTNTEPVVYVLADTDKMSIQAKNALLKVTEEPPQKAYFILTVTDPANTLKTLISRACVLVMDEYNENELFSYYCSKRDPDTLDLALGTYISKIASNPQEVDMLATYDINEFQEFVRTVAFNLHTVSSANAFKIEHKLALKKDEDKWDLLLFLQALKYELVAHYMEIGEKKYLKTYFLACGLVKELMYKNSVNKQYCLDQFILAVRKVWREE